MLVSEHLALRFVLTVAMGVACGAAFKRLRVPAGCMVGAFVGVAAFNCTAGGAWVPDATRTAVQIVAGAFVGCSMERSDLARLRKIGGPVSIMLGACLIVMLTAGATIALTSDLDVRTALMCAVPGGINDTPIVAADMGADAPTVAVLQLVRQILGIAVFPAGIAAFDRLRSSHGSADMRKDGVAINEEPRAKSKQRSAAATFAVIAASTICGLLGKATGIPGMTFAFAIVAALVLKLGFDFAYIPKQVKMACQLIAGCYLGTLLTATDIVNMGSLIVPIAVVVAFYTANCLITGTVESKAFGYGRKEGMLIASPAGASDMALILDDMKIRNTDIVIMQVIRATAVMTCFPQVVNLICFAIGG